MKLNEILICCIKYSLINSDIYENFFKFHLKGLIIIIGQNWYGTCWYDIPTPPL